MFVENSESRRFELSFSQADLGPTFGQELFFHLFFFNFGTFFVKICARSERYRNLTAGIFEIQLFMATPTFHLHRSYNKCFMFC